VVCPVYKASGGREAYSARGKNHLAGLPEYQRPTAAFEDIFAKCLLCGACSKACPRGIDVTREVIRARAGFSRYYGEHGFEKYLARKMLHRSEILGSMRTVGRAVSRLTRRLPKDSGLRLRLAMFEPQEAKLPSLRRRAVRPPAGAKNIIYFPGCSAEYLFPEIAEACRDLFAGHSFDLATPQGLGCCGLAVLAAGDLAGAGRLARRNIEILERLEGQILVSCASCFAHLRQYRELLADDPLWRDRAEAVSGRLVEMMQFLDGLLPPAPEKKTGDEEGRLQRVFYHDPCHLRHDLNITAEPRRILRRLQGVELVELPDGPQCCGQGGLFHLGAPELAACIRDDLAAKVLALHPDIITSTCSGCLMQWKTAVAAAGSTVPVVHLAELLRRAARPMSRRAAV
jgi:glycolate oxidase iron-sulfur subunit